MRPKSPLERLDPSMLADAAGYLRYDEMGSIRRAGLGFFTLKWFARLDRRHRPSLVVFVEAGSPSRMPMALRHAEICSSLRHLASSWAGGSAIFCSTGRNSPRRWRPQY